MWRNFLNLLKYLSTFHFQHGILKKIINHLANICWSCLYMKDFSFLCVAKPRKIGLASLIIHCASCKVIKPCEGNCHWNFSIKPWITFVHCLFTSCITMHYYHEAIELRNPTQNNYDYAFFCSTYRYIHRSGKLHIKSLTFCSINQAWCKASLKCSTLSKDCPYMVCWSQYI